MTDTPSEALLVCAGFGARLGSLGETQAKALLPVNGRPMLDYQLDQLFEFPGLRCIHLVTNQRFCADFRRWAHERKRRSGANRIDISVHDNGCTGARCAPGAVRDLQWVVNRLEQDKPCLVASGDNIFLFPLRPVWDAFRRDSHHRVLAVAETSLPRLRMSAVIALAPDDRVTNLWEKPETPQTSWSCPAWYCFGASLRQHLDLYLEDGGLPDSLGDFVSYLIQEDTVVASKVEGRRYHVSTPRSYEEADRAICAASIGGTLFPGSEGRFDSSPS